NGRRPLSKSGSLAPAALLLSTLARGAAETPLPDSGAFVERALNGGEEHSYSTHLERGKFLHIAVDQRGLDIITFLSDSSGRETLAVDSQLGMCGSETRCFASERSDLYRITVKAFDPEVVPGRYELRVIALRPATELDRVRAQASLAQYWAVREENVSTAASRRRALKAYEESIRLW